MRSKWKISAPHWALHVASRAKPHVQVHQTCLIRSSPYWPSPYWPWRFPSLIETWPIDRPCPGARTARIHGQDRGQQPPIPDRLFRIMRHKGGLGAAGSHPAVFPVALVEVVLTAFSDPGDTL